MYDSTTGTFPRGEEGVKIAVEKKFGEQAGQFAQFAVERLSVKTEVATAVPAAVDASSDVVATNDMQQSDELFRIRQLSGM
jgi:hypothetical protein